MDEYNICVECLIKKQYSCKKCELYDKKNCKKILIQSSILNRTKTKLKLCINYINQHTCVLRHSFNSYLYDINYNANLCNHNCNYIDNNIILNLHNFLPQLTEIDIEVFYGSKKNNDKIFIFKDWNMYNKSTINKFYVKIFDLSENLKYLRCVNLNNLNISNLPIGLEYLYCSNNLIEDISNLPTSIKYLDCSNNKIKHLDFLPDGLVYLNCSNNLLRKLENLPNSLKCLITGGNDIKSNCIIIPIGLKQLNDAKDMVNKKNVDILSGYKKYISSFKN